MRINELFENTNFDETDFVSKQNGKIDFDLAEDLTFFMNNDDDVYRRSVYPAIVKCLEAIEKNQKVKPSIFKQAALESYHAYQDKFPIRSLPSDLDEELCNEICEKIFKEVCEANSEKKKD